MAKYRYINTRLWDDDFFFSLDNEGKLVWLYLLTNSHTTISGIYELSMRRVAFETAIPVKIIEEKLKEFNEAGKLLYKNGWVGLRNWAKHQSQNRYSVVQGIRKDLQKCPPEMVHFCYENIEKEQPTTVTPPSPPRHTSNRDGYRYGDRDGNGDRDGKNKSVVFPVPLNFPEFLSVWKEWEKFRKEKRSPLTASSITKQLAFLAERHEVAIKIIDRSIQNGWTGLFPLPAERTNGNGNGYNYKPGIDDESTLDKYGVVRG